jgi:hypothetical protein
VLARVDASFWTFFGVHSGLAIGAIYLDDRPAQPSYISGRCTVRWRRRSSLPRNSLAGPSARGKAPKPQRTPGRGPAPSLLRARLRRPPRGRRPQDRVRLSGSRDRHAPGRAAPTAQVVFHRPAQLAPDMRGAANAGRGTEVTVMRCGCICRGLSGTPASWRAPGSRTGTGAVLGNSLADRSAYRRSRHWCGPPPSRPSSPGRRRDPSFERRSPRP